MSTYRANLLTRRDAIAAELAAITNDSLKTDSREYSEGLLSQLSKIDELLSHPNSREDADALAAERPKSWTLIEYGES